MISKIEECPVCGRKFDTHVNGYSCPECHEETLKP